MTNQRDTLKPILDGMFARTLQAEYDKQGRTNPFAKEAGVRSAVRHGKDVLTGKHVSRAYDKAKGATAGEEAAQRISNRMPIGTARQQQANKQLRSSTQNRQQAFEQWQGAQRKQKQAIGGTAATGVAASAGAGYAAGRAHEKQQAKKIPNKHDGQDKQASVERDGSLLRSNSLNDLQQEAQPQLSNISDQGLVAGMDNEGHEMISNMRLARRAHQTKQNNERAIGIGSLATGLGGAMLGAARGGRGALIGGTAGAGIGGGLAYAAVGDQRKRSKQQRDQYLNDAKQNATLGTLLQREQQQRRKDNNEQNGMDELAKMEAADGGQSDKDRLKSKHEQQAV